MTVGIRIRWVILAIAITLPALAFAWYWIAGSAGFLIFLFVYLAVPAAVAVAAALCLAGYVALRERTIRGVAPLLTLSAAIASLFLIPFSTLSMRTDFALKRAGMEDVVRDIALDGGPGEVLLGRRRLTAGDRWLVSGESIFAMPTECGVMVFFPTFFGVPDGAAGFLYAPPCAVPSDFPGERFGVGRWSVQSLPAEGWHRISGT
ncbi:hypothetical protein [Marinicauda salina]|nr:hypothetical protein [Marinicauda salina]